MAAETPTPDDALRARVAELEASVTELADLLAAYDRTSLLDPGLRRSLAQRRRRARDGARRLLSDEPASVGRPRSST